MNRLPGQGLESGRFPCSGGVERRLQSSRPMRILQSFIRTAFAAGLVLAGIALGSRPAYAQG